MMGSAVLAQYSSAGSSVGPGTGNRGNEAS